MESQEKPLSGFSRFIRGVGKHSRLILIFLLALAVGVILVQRGKIANRDATIAAQRNNIQAIIDTIKVSREQNGAVVASITGLLVRNREEIAAMKADLGREIAKLKGDIKTIVYNNTVIKYDSAPLVVVNPIPDVYSFRFDTIHNSANYLKIGGSINTRTNTGVLTDAEIGLGLTTGIRKEGDFYKIFATTDHPKATITKLEGALIDKKYFEPVTPTKLTTFSLAVGQNLISYNYKDHKVTALKPEINVTAGVSFNLSELISRTINKKK